MYRWACRLLLSLHLGLAALAAGAGEAAPKPLLVFAAASTQEAVNEVAAAFTKEQGVPVKGNFASSATLARQLEQGAPADLYISASVPWMTYADEHHLLLSGTRSTLLTNELVLITPADRPLAVAMRKDFDLPALVKTRLAIGDPERVPAGSYAKQALQALGWWDALQPRLAPASDVRDALRLVEQGEVDAGIVYATDAALSPKVKVVGVFPAATHDRIAYQVACSATAAPAARQFLAFLRGPVATAIFQRYGFLVPAPAPP